MNFLRSFFLHTTIVVCFLVTNSVYSQMFSPQVEISFGAGMNLSYFDIGGGTPGLSLGNSILYQWDEHWKAGYKIGFHNVVGTDEGTDLFGRGLAYNSNLYEFSGRIEYLFFFSTSWKSIWKQKINPMLPFGGTWKRRIKPFIYVGGGILHHLPYVYTYPTGDGLDENPAYAKLIPNINGGFGIYYYFNRFWSIAVETQTNFPLFNYIEGYSYEEYPDSWDMFHTVGIRIIWSHSSGAKTHHGRRRRR